MSNTVNPYIEITKNKDKHIAELEEIIEEWRAERDSIREEREQLKAENQRLRNIFSRIMHTATIGSEYVTIVLNRGTWDVLAKNTLEK